MDQLQKQVSEFHRAFDCVIHEKPTVIDHEIARLRISLIEEELDELILALGFSRWASGTIYKNPNQTLDLVEVADALGDLLYVIYGTAVSCGLDMEPINNEIHRSNMSKVFPDGSVQRREDGKVLKPDSYSPADVAKMVQRQTDWWTFRRCAALKAEIEAMAEGGEELSGTDAHREFDKLMAALPQAARDEINKM